jgi:hypothetical protein
MSCRICNSDDQRNFNTEINVHFPGLKNLDKPTVFVFPEILVCMDCGFTELVIPESELRLLGTDGGAPGTRRSTEIAKCDDLN